MGSDRVTRRRVLEAGALVWGIATAGCSGQEETETPPPASPSPTASPTATQTSESTPDNIAPWDLAATVTRWAWYPKDPALWSRSTEPYDIQQDGKRWLAEPTAEGSVRCRIENDAPPGNAGFYIDLGAMNQVGPITIETETVQSDSAGDQQLAVALYADVSDDGDYFNWTPKDGREAFAGLGGDVEGLGLVPAGGEVTLDAETKLDLVPPKETKLVTIGDLQRGVIAGADPLSRVALQVGVFGSGAGNTEEVIVHRVGVDEAERTVSEMAWPVFNYDASNTGRTPAEGPTEPVAPAWTVETEGAVRSSPAVVDGTVYVGSDDGHVYAIDAATGTTEWTYRTDGPVVSSPAFLRHVVYVGSDDGRLYALSARTGEELWTYETGDRIRSSPTVQGSGVPAGIERLVAFGSDDGGFYALDPVTGEEVKTFQTTAPIVSKPLIQHNGNGAWGIRFANTDQAGKGYLWNPQDTDGYGAIITMEDPPKGPAAPSHAALSEPGPGHAWYRANEVGELRVLELTLPAPTFETGGPIRTTPVVGDSLVYVGSWDGHIYAVEPPTKDAPSIEQAWAFETGGKVNSSPAVAAGTLYAGSDDGHVYALDAATGEPLWTYETGGEVVSSPAVVDGTVYVGSNDGRVYALAAPES